MLKSRREVVGALAASGAVLARRRQRARQPGRNGPRPYKKETDIACLYHCDFGDPQRFSQMLQNMLNHYSAYEFDSVQAQAGGGGAGGGLKFFLEDLPARRGRRTRSIRTFTSASSA